ncbi:hypothetical protein Tco_0858247 [Tanacetum coccineum]|uniref:Reverse transcriptase RNase H-like domain-containing protein n=1 Tax=Tanacetum coccineum TaxID=301880 RepID=A0ABQ5B8L1_9ASTR
MVKEGIVADIKISKSGDLRLIELKAVIAKLPHPTSVKVSKFWARGFYRRFIQNFQKLPVLWTHLLEKETPLFLSEECVDSFQHTQKKIDNDGSILIAPDWDLPFELIVTDNSAIKYLFAKKDATARSCGWILLLQEFDIEIRDSIKELRILAADHLFQSEKFRIKTNLRTKKSNESISLETLGDKTLCFWPEALDILKVLSQLTTGGTLWYSRIVKALDSVIFNSSFTSSASFWDY